MTHETTPADIQTLLRESFSRQTMMQTLGATITAIAPGTVEITAPILPTSLQQNGFGHAALAFAIGDSSAGYSAMTLTLPTAEVLTAEIKINLLAPSTGDQLIARGKVIRPGKRLIVVQSSVVAVQNGVEVEIAILQGTMVPIQIP